MSFKKSMRTAQRVTREIDKAQRAQQRTEEAFRDIEARLKKQPLSVLNVRYDRDAELLSEKLEFKTSAGPALYGIDGTPPSHMAVEPPEQSIDGITVRPLDLLFSHWATLVPLEIDNGNDDLRPSVNWVKKSERQSSSIFLLDPKNGEYYYPIETNLTGQVLPGYPRTGFFPFYGEEHVLLSRG